MNDGTQARTEIRASVHAKTVQSPAVFALPSVEVPVWSDRGFTAQTAFVASRQQPLYGTELNEQRILF